MAGLQFAKDLVLPEFILEGDSLFVYRALAGLSPPSAVVALLVYGILDYCHEVHNVRFSCMQRKRNKPTHLLTEHTLGIIDFLVWTKENPCFLEQTLHHDLMSFIN